MKKIRIVGILTAILIFGAVCSVPIVNNVHANKVEKDLLKVPVPKETVILESLSKAGKLTGNGNGMQYFGAILIKSELSLEELKTYYSFYRDNEWKYVVENQRGQDIKAIEHGSLQFKEKVEDEGYFIVYSWGEGIEILEDLDIRGH